MSGKKPKKRGLFLVLEGIDGAGTTTQGKRLRARLSRRGYRVQFTYQPSGGVVGRHIRRCLGQASGPSADRLALLFAADRLDHYETVIRPTVESGGIVICDRYMLSSLAYQGAEGDIRWVSQLNSRAPLPDLTIFLDVSAQLAAKRRQQRGQQADRYEVTSFQKKVVKLYRQLVQDQSFGPIEVIDGRATAADISKTVFEVVGPLCRGL